MLGSSKKGIKILFFLYIAVSKAVHREKVWNISTFHSTSIVSIKEDQNASLFLQRKNWKIQTTQDWWFFLTR